MRILKSNLTLLAFAVALIVGCNNKPGGDSPPSGDQADGKRYLLATEPDGGKDVAKAKKEAKDGEDIVIVGRIGGSEDPWVKGQAAFTIVDPAVDSCRDIEGDTCETPWDYCCRLDELPAGTAFVKVVDANGKIVKVGAQKLLSVEPLQTVVVKGKAKVIEGGNLHIFATGIYVRK